MQYGQHPAPRFTIAHLSDVHLLPDGVRQYGVIDPEAGLRLALARLTRLERRPDALVFTGDLADRADPEAYARLRELVDPVAAELGAEVVWVVGNHDERAPFARGLLGASAGTDVDPEQPLDRVHDLGGLRLVALDTTVTGFHHGELSDDQLSWLADVLAEPAEHGTVVAMHHPPIPVPMVEVNAVIELHDQHRLEAVVRGTDVRQVLGGHFHYSSYSTFAGGVPVSVASASCYVSDPAPLERFVSGVDGHQSFTVCHVYDDRIVHTVVPLAEVPEITGFPADVRAQVEALTWAERHDMFARKDSDFNSVNEDHSPRDRG